MNTLYGILKYKGTNVWICYQVCKISTTWRLTALKLPWSWVAINSLILRRRRIIGKRTKQLSSTTCFKYLSKQLPTNCFSRQIEIYFVNISLPCYMYLTFLNRCILVLRGWYSQVGREWVMLPSRWWTCHLDLLSNMMFFQVKTSIQNYCLNIEGVLVLLWKGSLKFI